MAISAQDLEKLPYFQIRPIGNRAPVLIPFFHNNEFCIPFLIGTDLKILKALDSLTGGYMAIAPQKPEIDLNLPFMDFIVQRIANSKNSYLLDTIISDVSNLGVILERYHLYLRAYKGGTEVPLLMASELETLFINVRSLYDQLQKVIREVWSNTTLLDPAHKKTDLPYSFREVCIHGADDIIRSVDEIIAKYGLPEPIAEFYFQHAKFFKLCRAIRDNVIHRGTSFRDGPVFQVPGGVAVDITTYPYSEFACWKSESLQNGKLGSARTLIAHIVQQSIRATSDYTDALMKSNITLPIELGPDWHVYFRHPLVAHLLRLDTYIDQPWVQDARTQ